MPDRSTLSGAEPGKSYILIGLDGGQGLVEKISAMGLNMGVTFKVVTNSGHGPVSLEVRQTRLGIGRGMAERIRIREVEVE